jgi:hypothetical protein
LMSRPAGRQAGGTSQRAESLGGHPKPAIGGRRGKVAGTLSFLDEADQAGFIVFDNAIAELPKTSFRVSQAVLWEIKDSERAKDGLPVSNSEWGQRFSRIHAGCLARPRRSV